MYPILHWLFENLTELKTRAYLARYLVKLEVPPDQLADQELNDLNANVSVFLCSLSVHEVKNNCGLFKRLFKVNKNGVFLLGISFFFLEIFTFLYYANGENDEVIGGAIKTVNQEYL